MSYMIIPSELLISILRRKKDECTLEILSHS